VTGEPPGSIQISNTTRPASHMIQAAVKFRIDYAPYNQNIVHWYVHLLCWLSIKIF